MIQRYNTVIQVAIRIDLEKVSKEDAIKVLNKNGAMFYKMFPEDITQHHKIPVNTIFISQVHRESHQITYDIVGNFIPSHYLIMECNSDKECIQKHFTRTINEFFGDIDHEYQVFSLDNIICEGNSV